MKQWTRWMPLAFVVWFARKRSERMQTPYGVFAIPFNDVMIKVED